MNATLTATRTVGRGQYARPVADLVLGGEHFVQDASGAVYRECRRCGGTGVKPEFGHVYAGECFGCRWTGLEHRFADEAAALKAAKRNTRRAARDAAKREADAVVALAATRERDHAEALRMDAARTAQQERAAVSRYAGEVGEKVTVTAVVRVDMEVDGFRPGSYSRFVILEGTGEHAGITIKTVGTSEAHYAMEKGATVTLTATVKAHGERNGEKVTQVVRPKIG